MRNPILFLATFLSVAVGWFALAGVMDWDSALLITAFGVLVCVLISLAIYRLMLMHYEHEVRVAGTAANHPLLQWFRQREHQVDHVGVVLTLIAALYGSAVVLFVVSRILDTTLRRLINPFSIR